MSVVAGLRHRLLHDSFHAHVTQALNTLGWLDPGRAHKPVKIIGPPLPWHEPIEPNTITVDFMGSDTFEAEVGSRLTSEVIVGFVEIYAQDDSFGLHIANDLRDWFRGRLQNPPMPGVHFPIYDLRQPTPGTIGYMDIRNISALRNAAVELEMWTRHWYRVRCEITDTY